MSKCFQAINNLELTEGSGGDRPTATAMTTSVGVETATFTKELKLMGKVEVYLQDVIDTMVNSLRDIAKDSYKRRQTIHRDEWLFKDPAQITLLINQCQWVQDVEAGFNSGSVKDLYSKQVESLTALIKMVQGDLEKPMRMKIMTMITLDTHNRDIIDKLVQEGVKKPEEF